MSSEQQGTMISALDQWLARGWIRPLDYAFSSMIEDLCREQGEPPSPLLQFLAALTSHQVGRGHVYIDLEQLINDAEMTVALPPEEQGIDVESDESASPALNPAHLLAKTTLEDCREALEQSSASGDGSCATPLVLEGSRLYLRRFWRYQQQISAGIEQRLTLPSALADETSVEADTLRQALAVLFEQSDEPDFQKIACALAARSRFSVITGGPGTGKTTTVVKLLAALQAVASETGEGRKNRIRLAAPTGKAAARLNESIGSAVESLPVMDLPGDLVTDDIPTKVTTLHRLLGSRPGSRKFRHDSENLLPVDILVIDEASMVDVDLMSSVIDALPESTQLILLGDKDQLASVDAGAILGELCSRAKKAHYTPSTSKWLKSITGYQIPNSLTDPEGNQLDQAVCMLRKSYRFDEHSGIGTLANAVNENRLTETLLEQCRNQVFDDVVLLDSHQGTNGTQASKERQNILRHHAINGSPEAFRNKGEGREVNGKSIAPPVGYKHYLSILNNHSLNADSPIVAWDDLGREILEAFGQFQILCALRKGPWGVEGINQLVEGQLQGEKLIRKTEDWYAGRPVLMTGNDYNLGLMNGDVGIAISVPWDKDERGETRNTLRIAFPASDGTNGIRWISPSRLGQLETVYAMTVHKSQGSEFGHCCLVLPERVGAVMTSELVYTGITRARNWLSLVGSDQSLKWLYQTI